MQTPSETGLLAHASTEGGRRTHRRIDAQTHPNAHRCTDAQTHRYVHTHDTQRRKHRDAEMKLACCLALCREELDAKEKEAMRRGVISADKGVELAESLGLGPKASFCTQVGACVVLAL